MEIGNLNRSLKMFSIENPPTQFGYSALSLCFWIRIIEKRNNVSNSSKTVIIHTPELSIWMGGEGGIFIQLAGRQPLKVDLLSYWTHMCFSLKRRLVVYINGYHFMASHIHLRTKVTSIDSILHFGELDAGEGDIIKGQIAEFYLMNKELEQKDIENFFPFNTGSRDYEYIATWYKLITHAKNQNIDLPRFVL